MAKHTTRRHKMRGGAMGTLDVSWKVGNKALRDGMFNYIDDLEERDYDVGDMVDDVYEKLKTHAEGAGFRNVNVFKNLDEVDVEFDKNNEPAVPGQLSFSVSVEKNGVSKNLAISGTFGLRYQGGGRRRKRSHTRKH